MPAFDGGDDFVRVRGPCEGLWRLGCFGEVDGFLEMSTTDRKTPRFKRWTAWQVAFHGIEPRARCRREVEDEALVPVEPGAHLRMLVRCVVVEDEMDDFSGRNLGVDGVQKTDELLMTVPPLRPMTVPSSTLKAANRVVVPWRL